MHLDRRGSAVGLVTGIAVKGELGDGGIRTVGFVRVQRRMGI